MPHQNETDSLSEKVVEQHLSHLVKAYVDEKLKESNKNNDNAANKSWKRSWRSTSPITKATLLLTAGVAFATIAYAFIAAYQLGEMRHTNDLTREALKKADQNSVESSDQFQVQIHHYDDALGQTKEIAKQTLAQAQHSDMLAKDTHALADTSRTQSISTRKIAESNTDQLDIMKNQLELSREALIGVQRAVVTTGSLKIVRKPGIDGKIESLKFYVGFRNDGNTATKNLRFSHHWQVINSPSERFDLIDTLPRPDSPPAFASAHKEILSIGEEVDIATIQRVIDHKAFVVFWGRADYSDVFPGTNSHITEYCAILTGFEGEMPTTPNSDKPTTATDYNCETHNCYDDDCKVK
ncbi:hypothetical protein HDF16_001591 [Granulicella aggregans]|uniref:Uncharacterized protein n=1 Tax=Granulicella aggregans TaxID=474949 RepID=A0A7W7ZCN2_9BACT|nr:hypothetical protein [Granulicella aggregans]MBB5056906.1 hypothetical protein [Granulicella aggregans]